MNLASRQTVELLCATYGFRPQRSAGQNFLVSETTLQTIVEAAGLTADDTVLEIGAGFGTLTTELVSRAGKVIAVELDKRLITALQKIARVSPSLTVVGGDIFQQWPELAKKLIDTKYKLVANLPYNITSLVLRNFLEQQPRPSEMVVLVQKEVAERVTSKPGAMSILSVAVQFFSVPTIVDYVPRQNFWPVPEVDSAILHLNAIGDDANGFAKKLGTISSKEFFRIVKIGFAAKRKQLHNTISAGLRIADSEAVALLKKTGIDPKIRPQDLAIDDWINIIHTIHTEKTK